MALGVTGGALVSSHIYPDDRGLGRFGQAGGTTAATNLTLAITDPARMAGLGADRLIAEGRGGADPIGGGGSGLGCLCG